MSEAVMARLVDGEIEPMLSVLECSFLDEVDKGITVPL